MTIFLATNENIRKAADIIRAGGLVSFPTETVYGLGADALNPVAAARIFEAKRRPFFDPLIVHVAELGELDLVAHADDPRVMDLARRFWPGPLTLVLPRRSIVPDIVTAGLDTVAVRMPMHDVALGLIREAGTPVAAPSANPFGYISPTQAQHVASQLGDRIDMILDGGPCSVGVESTIIRLDAKGAALLRPGGLAVERIEDVLGPLKRDRESVHQAPGTLPSHYAPRARVQIISDIRSLDYSRTNTGFILFKGTDVAHGSAPVEILSRNGDLCEAAANLFSALHRLDSMNLMVIYAEAVPEEGLGIAIMDRLRRASARRIE